MTLNIDIWLLDWPKKLLSPLMCIEAYCPRVDSCDWLFVLGEACRRSIRCVPRRNGTWSLNIVLLVYVSNDSCFTSSRNSFIQSLEILPAD